MIDFIFKFVEQHFALISIEVCLFLFLVYAIARQKMLNAFYRSDNTSDKHNRK